MLVLTSALWVTVAHAQQALTDEQARRHAADTVAKANSSSANELNTRRREDLEDALFSFQRKIAGHIHKAAYFYDVVNGGYQITVNEVTYSTPTERWLVAVSTEDGQTFGLEGFTEGVAAFNRLMSKADVEIRNASQAQAFTSFYLGGVYGDADNVLYDDLRLRHKVEEHFAGYSDSQEPLAKKEQRYRSWWTRFKARQAGRLAPNAKPEGEDAYLVTLNVLSMTVGRPPEVSQWSVRVQSNGDTQLLGKRAVFPIYAADDKGREQNH